MAGPIAICSLPSTTRAIVMATVAFWMPTSKVAAIACRRSTRKRRGIQYPRSRPVLHRMSATAPTVTTCSRRTSRLLTSARTIMTKRMTIEAILIGFSRRSVALGKRRRTNIPIATGTSTITTTLSISSGCSAILRSVPMKNRIERLTTIGRVKTEITELMAVRVMLSATSARAMWLNKLAVVPPGAAARSIIPTAISPGSPNRITSPKQIPGKTSNCTASAVIAAFGNVTTRLKSSMTRLRPSPNITTANANGRRMTVRADSMEYLSSGAPSLVAWVTRPTPCQTLPSS